ncbi:hypothetical protein BJ875DRAFT_503628 [Amylocarpus encephaloides]|uniref:T6SS Phospholipase effector Tle1-like catalytic domain-containing protein n=1 Tax=Amylocarpus encephaloides TaxID=45428 RepID=A0A9P7YM09_9HELO|nr:hypothetical protein BJ875DRAFT_503628 [Amylocarpus encephaloides]
MNPSNLSPNATWRQSSHDRLRGQKQDTNGFSLKKWQKIQETANKLRKDSRDEIRAKSPQLEIEIQNTRKKIVLCFDGTGNKFHGDSSDSNILKIFRMLDRSGGALHYYQPGIGTYVNTSSLSYTGSWARLKNWYEKTKDSAVGTSFDKHVVGGYKFLMQYYSEGDDIYMFGFSRGSYTARFLAEMLDWMGLVTHGNEEMVQFAWRTFAKWKSINGDDDASMKARKKAYEFMVSFRETFSRPVRRIRYLGLFDTVNSVPRFETAMMSRKHMPFSAKSSAKMICHAVAIDERRAKFRSDLISWEGNPKKQNDVASSIRPRRHSMWFHETNRYKPKKRTQTNGHKHSDRNSRRYRANFHSRSRSPTGNSICSSANSVHFDDGFESSDGDEEDQDIQEVWFPGGHADIGGGWALDEDETPLSHVPLVWIVREARKSGLDFDEEKMKSLGCYNEISELGQDLPTVEISGEKHGDVIEEKHDPFRHKLHQAHAGKIHDCLAYNQGLTRLSVLNWKMMEWIPFRRMDLTNDGSWKPVRWPLPRGEVRDMPDKAKVHSSAIKRMQNDAAYRPGNLILGGGGVGAKKAPPEAGIGEWVIIAEEGDHVGECFVRKEKKCHLKSDE